MIKKYLLSYKTIFAAGAVLTVFLMALVFNAYNQAYNFNRAARPDAQIAVFTAAGSKAAPEVILEKLVNLDGVDRADYIPKEKVLEKAQSENSKLKNVVLSGENPFLPYYLVVPKKVSAASAKALAARIGSIEGVDEAVYDDNLFSAVEKTGSFAATYRNWGKTAAAVVLLLIALKFVLRWLREELNIVTYIYNVLLGAAAGALGAGIFYLLSLKVAPNAVMNLPAHYAAYFVAGGILIVLLWENDQG